MTERPGVHRRSGRARSRWPVTGAAEAPGIRVRIIETPTLGDRSYLVSDGQVALVIDPQRDIDRLVACAAEEGVRVTHVAETHLHNDYASGGLVLARSVGASYLMARGDTVAFDRTPIVDNEEIVVGRMTVTAMATPGHTVHHLAYAVSVGGRCVGVFTGGSMLYGATGRSDLVSPELAEDLTRDQYRSVRRLAGVLDPATHVYPTGPEQRSSGPSRCSYGRGSLDCSPSPISSALPPPARKTV